MAGESWCGASESWISLVALLGKSPQKLMSCPDMIIVFHIFIQMNVQHKSSFKVWNYEIEEYFGDSLERSVRWLGK